MYGSINVRFYLPFLEGLRKDSYRKGGFSYKVSYLIDKKEYRIGKIIRENDCRFKK